jgi:general secretion pathway protein C
LPLSELMEPYFKKYFWTFRLAAIGILALLLAGVVSALLARALTPYTTAVPAAPLRADASQASQRQGPRPEVRNVLPEPPPPEVVDKCKDVECGADEQCNPASGACEKVEPVDSGVELGKCRETDLALALVGTVVAPDPAWSMAVLHNPGTNKTQFAAVGTVLLTEAEVTRIERNRVFVKRQGREECLRPGDASARAGRAPGAGPNRAAVGAAAPVAPGAVSTNAPTGAPGVTGGTLEDRIRTGVVAAGPNQYSVDRNLVREVAGNSKLLQEQAPRVVPYYEGGKARGFRLQGLKTTGLFSAIGIRNGDVVLSVNGNPVDSPQRALDIYQNMMTQNSVNLTVLRRGKEETLNFSIK